MDKIMYLASGSEIDDALQRLGELLEAEGQEFAIVILGGAALNLLGIIKRATTDVDIVAFARATGAEPTELREPPEPMPSALERAARAVARDMALDDHWLNTGPALQWRAGLPPGLAHRVQWRRYGTLWVGIVDRYDLIFFKLFAAADQVGPATVHYRDLLALRPTRGELDAAAEWVKTQDASSDFAQVLNKVVDNVRQDLELRDTSASRGGG